MNSSSYSAAAESSCYRSRPVLAVKFMFDRHAVIGCAASTASSRTHPAPLYSPALVRIPLDPAPATTPVVGETDHALTPSCALQLNAASPRPPMPANSAQVLRATPCGLLDQCTTGQRVY